YPHISFFTRPPPPRPTLFPYTTLFRSPREGGEEQRHEGKPGPSPGASEGKTGSHGASSEGKTRFPYCVQRGNRQSFSPGSSSFRSEEPRLNSSHDQISYAVFCLKKKTT